VGLHELREHGVEDQLNREDHGVEDQLYREEEDQLGQTNKKAWGEKNVAWGEKKCRATLGSTTVHLDPSTLNIPQ
jgi:hypothetical protein